MDLAIVIPAYKKKYLRETLESFDKQTYKKFNIYIGDDNSPEDLYTIVEDFESTLNIKYCKFAENIGGIDLIKHWERSINLSKTETWIWLFPDDDFVSPDCVETFFKVQNSKPNLQLFRFNKTVIDGSGYNLKSYSSPEGRIDALQLLKSDFDGTMNNTLPEFIFSRKVYNTLNGFVNLPLAWGSDKATWYKFSKDEGCYTLANGTVYFRQSGINISSINNKFQFIKLNASLDFYKWILWDFLKNNCQTINHNFNENNLRIMMLNRFYYDFLKQYTAINTNQVWKISKKIRQIFNKPLIYTFLKLCFRNMIRKITDE